MFVLAEIGDKMPSVHSTLLVSIVLTAIVLGLAGIKWWLAIIALPVFGLWNWICYIEIQEPGFGNQIWSEMGTGYVVGRFVAINVPIVIGGVMVVWFRRSQIRRQRRSNNLCANCGYPVVINQCPECGASVRHPGAD